MDISKEVTGNLIILSLTGRLDTINFPLLDNEMTALLESGRKLFILDCQNLDYVSSSGLRILLKSLKQVKSSGGRLTICALQPQIAQVFKISGFDHLFEIYPGKPEALASYK
jgi:anti-sigma B factor antagonist